MDSAAGDGDGAGRRPTTVVVVGVKLDSRSRELLTWALVKASLPGDQVIALHVLDPSTTAEETTSLLSLLNSLDSVLSVYEGFCNLKQVDLKLKVCRGKSVRKILVREAKSHPFAAVVVGVSKTRRGIRSPASVAKHCAGKLPRRCAVFAVDGGRVVFKREATDCNDHDVVLVHENVNALNVVESNSIRCRHSIRKSCSECRTKTVEGDFGSCDMGSALLSDKHKCHHRIRKSCSKCRTKTVGDDCFSSETGLGELSDKHKCHHRIRKSCSKCRTKIVEDDCVSCEMGSVLLSDKHKCHHRIRKSCSKCRTKADGDDCVSSKTGLGELSDKYKCHHHIRKSCSKCRTKIVEDDCVSCEMGSALLSDKHKCHHRIRKLCSKCRKKVVEEDCVSSETGSALLSDNHKFHHRIRKSCSKCRTEILEEDCVSSETGSVLLPGSSATQSEDDLSASDVEGNPLALVSFQANQASVGSLEIHDSQCLKPSWALLRRWVLPKRRCNEKSVEKSSGSLRALRLPRLHSSVIYPDQKQIISNQDQSNDHNCSALDGESGAIIPFGHNIASPHHSRYSSLEGFSEELWNLNEKYSATCRLFSFQELLEATSNFSPGNMVGRGGSSCVYRGCFPDGNEFAVKILKPSENVIKDFVQEIEIITALNHKNIVSLCGFCFEDDNLLLVYDFLSRGSLEENLHDHKMDGNAFGWQERYNVAIGVAEALDYLHCGCAEPVIHRDVKSSNILLSDDFEPQLSDFGLASWASASSHTICTDVAGTFGYLAPEYLMHGKVSDKIDVYAFGVVLLELLSGRKPINRECPKEQESLVMWAKPILKRGKVSQLLDPILCSSDSDQEKIERMVLAATLCISHVPTLRPSISVVLKLLQGDEEVIRWATQQATASDYQDEDIEGEPLLTNIQSHLNLALLDIGDDSHSISSSERSISLDDYLRGSWSRSSSFD